MNNILEVHNLSKQFRSAWVYRKKAGIEDVSFSVKKGESFALLGANGAGKTTTIKNVLGFLKPDAGSVIYKGKTLLDPGERSSIGFLPEQPYFYQYLSVEETLNFYAGLFSLQGDQRKERVGYVLEKLSIAHKKKERLRNLSKGQQQRVGLAQVLLNDPDLLILDEPFSGLDPLSRVEIRNLLQELKKEGKSMIISSHILSDIEMLCDRAIILNGGKVKVETDISGLLRAESSGYRFGIEIPEDKVRESITSQDKLFSGLEKTLLELEPVVTKYNSETHGNAIRLYEFKKYEDAKIYLEYCLKNEIKILEFSRIQKSLEDIFISASLDSSSGSSSNNS